MGVKASAAAVALIVAGYTGGMVAIVHFTEAEVQAQQQDDGEEGAPWRYGCWLGAKRYETSWGQVFCIASNGGGLSYTQW